MSEDTPKLLNACVEYRAMVDKLEAENAAMRKMLSDAEELERYSGSDGRRQWGKCSSWLYPDDAVITISAKAFDELRKETQQSVTK